MYHGLAPPSETKFPPEKGHRVWFRGSVVKVPRPKVEVCSMAKICYNGLWFPYALLQCNGSEFTQQASLIFTALTAVTVPSFEADEIVCYAQIPDIQ